MSHLGTSGYRRRPRAGAVLGLVLLMVLGTTRGQAQGEEAPGVVISTATRCLNVREGPDTSNRALRCVPPDTRMDLLESGPEWGRVRLQDGTEGWVALRLVSRQDEAPAKASGIEDRQTLLRRLGELDARARRLEEELAARQAESSLLEQSVEDSRELFAARLAESDRLLATSAALRQRLEEEKAALVTRVADLESELSAARSTAQSDAAARAEAEAAAALRERELAERLEAASARRRSVEQESAELAARAAELELTTAAREEGLSAALEDSREQRRALEEENAELASEIAEAESTVSAHREELSEALAAANAAERQLEEEKAQRQGAERRNAELAKQVAELGSAGSAREQELAEALAAAETQRRSVEEENAALAARVDELESDVSAMRTEAQAQATARAEAEAREAARAESESAASAREQELRQALSAADAQRRTLEQEKAELETRLGAVESGHAEAVAQLESRLRAAEGFLAASEAERRALAERLAAAERAAPDSAAGAVKPLRVSIPEEGAAEPTPAPAPGSAAGGSEEALRGELLAVVEGWAAAWSERRVDDYLSFYSGNFEPPSGTGRAQWEADRRSLVGRPEEIEVDVALMDIRIDGPSLAEVDLIQSYESSAYSDTVLKTLTLGRERDGWRILRETVAEE